MKLFIRLFFAVALFTAAAFPARAQVKLEDIPFDLSDILGKAKLLKVQKGFSPVFMLGNFQVNKVGILGEKLKGIGILGDIFGSKQIEQVTKLYKTYKTGLVVFKVLAAAGTAATVVSTVKGITDDQGFNASSVKGLLYPALASLGTGIATKLLTKAASYKAVDLFNGVVKKTLKDILSVKPASSTLGVGLYVQL
ncbi:MAG: hypothetical protein ABIT96_04090 [Ferruginibacter sp.]